MKPCSEKQKLIALLAANALELQAQQALRSHLDRCEGCRRYFDEISNVAKKLQLTQAESLTQPSEAFHQNLMGALAKTKRESAFENFWAEMWSGWNWRLALPATAVAIAAWFAVPPRAQAPVTPQVVVAHVAPLSRKPDLRPTFANYEMALHQSVDKLDELLQEQSNKTSPPPSPIYTAAQFPQRNLTD